MNFCSRLFFFYELGIIFLSLLKTFDSFETVAKRAPIKAHVFMLSCTDQKKKKRKKKVFLHLQNEETFVFTRIGLLNEKSSKERKEQ